MPNLGNNVKKVFSSYEEANNLEASVYMDQPTLVS